MSNLTIFLLIAWAVFGGAYLGRASAFKEFTEEKARMNLKMQQCLALVTSKTK